MSVNLFAFFLKQNFGFIRRKNIRLITSIHNVSNFLESLVAVFCDAVFFYGCIIFTIIQRCNS